MKKIALTLLWTTGGAFALSALSGCNSTPVQTVPPANPVAHRDTRVLPPPGTDPRARSTDPRVRH